VVEGLTKIAAQYTTACQKLAKAISTAVNHNLACASFAGGMSTGTATSTIQIEENRIHLNLQDAIEVNAEEAWLVQLYMAMATLAPAPDVPERSAQYGMYHSSNNDSGCKSSSSCGGDTRESVEAVLKLRKGFGWQCFHTNNTTESERLLFQLIHEIHRQTLLSQVSVL
jgi:hypothetical protein